MFVTNCNIISAKKVLAIRGGKKDCYSDGARETKINEIFPEIIQCPQLISGRR